MTESSNQRRPADAVVDGVSGALVGGGIVTMALFPLALPILALTAVALLPLVLIGLAAGLVGAILAAPILLVRRLARRARRPAASEADHTPAIGWSVRPARNPSH
jgi:hypothetical protein